MLLKEIQEALQAARRGDDVDLSELVVPRAIACAVTRAKTDPERVRSFVWSDNSVDRDNDTIKQSGWKLSQFRKNGPILWAHSNRDLPLGTPKGFKVDGKGDEARLLGDVVFSKTNPMADIVLMMVDEGVLKNVSVGFRPLEWIYNEERGGIDFQKQELLEGSIVPVGSNPNAMADLASSKSIDMAPMLDWAERSMDDGGGEEIEAIYKAMTPWKKTKGGVVVPVDAEPEAGGDDIDDLADDVAKSVADSLPEPEPEPEPELEPTAEERAKAAIDDICAKIADGSLPRSLIEDAYESLPEPPPPTVTIELSELPGIVKECLDEVREEKENGKNHEPVGIVDAIKMVRAEVRERLAEDYKQSGRLPT